MQRVLRAATALLVGWLVVMAGTGTAFAAGGNGPAATADHTKFKELDKDFQSGPEVTRACLGCHTEASTQVMHTQHWTWEFVNPKSKELVGKRHVVNNYCTSAVSNLHACTSCHIGYAGLTDKGGLSTDPERVDCLVCHDTTGSYRKPSGLNGNVFAKDVEMPPGSGNVIRGTNLKRIAQNVGKTSRQTCGSCHFFGGGGDGVKQGEMDSSLEEPDKNLDVHMNADGLNFTCATCHRTEGHAVPGSRYAPTAVDKDAAQMRGMTGERNPATCQSCHGQKPHKGEQAARLDNHSRVLACQTCHVPAMARGGVSTMLSWDWSTAGKRDEKGKPLSIRDDLGNPIYKGHKGTATFGDNVRPDYIWFNGDVEYTLPTEKIESTERPIYINRFLGSADDGRSKIWPIKTHVGKQPYDPVNKTLAVTQLAGANDTAYWTNLNWERAIAAGMKTAGLPFSGQVGFIETVSQWPVNHMVAPKEKTVGCSECHAKDGRLDKVEGIYIPGRDNIQWLDNAMKVLVALTLLGVLAHGVLRIFTSKKH